MRESRPIALDVYEELAESYAAKVDTKPHNAYYERPATLSLLPDVQGKDVLDAGCGPGAYASILVERGATVVGFDVSPKMVACARARVERNADFHIADIERPLTFLDDASFDVVLCPLVLSSVADLGPVFREFHRVLRTAGTLVFSEGHPVGEYLYWKTRGQTGSYFATERVGCDWHGFGKSVYMPSFRRPLGELFNPLIESGFRLDRILEPLPTDEFRRADPRHYEELQREPAFICIRAIREPCSATASARRARA